MVKREKGSKGVRETEGRRARREKQEISLENKYCPLRRRAGAWVNPKAKHSPWKGQCTVGTLSNALSARQHWVHGAGPLENRDKDRAWAAAQDRPRHAGSRQGIATMELFVFVQRLESSMAWPPSSEFARTAEEQFHRCCVFSDHAVSFENCPKSWNDFYTPLENEQTSRNHREMSTARTSLLVHRTLILDSSETGSEVTWASVPGTLQAAMCSQALGL